MTAARPSLRIGVILLGIALCVVLWTAIASRSYDLATLFTGYGKFFGLGLIGAIFANSTGAGGGVVFIPAFTALAFEPPQALATSFAIQCFGMTAGAITWWRYRREAVISTPQWQYLPKLLAVCVPASWLGLSAVAIMDWHSPADLHVRFSLFSIVLGLSLFVSLRWARLDRRQQPVVVDYLLLAIISLVGGVVTAWLSVGVGELVAVYLLWRRFDVRLAVAVAVIVSAASVWLAGSYLVSTTDDVVWPVVMFAGPAAVCGGILARYLATWVNPMHLKAFFAAWVLLAGLVGIFI